MVVAALSWMVVPLLKAPVADASEVSSHRKERRLSGVVVAALVPLLAVGMYVGLSNWDWQAVEVETAQNANMEQALKTLEAKLADNPNNLEGWMMLGRSYTAMGRYPRAVDAFEQAYHLSQGQNVEAIVGLGEALALTDEASLTGRAGKLFDTALSVAPNHPKALWYGSMAALRSGDLRRARDRLHLLMAQNPPEQLRGLLERQIQDLDQQLGEGGQSASPPAAASSEAAVGATRAIKVSVSLSPELRQQVSKDTPLFVLARDPNAGGPPLAVKKLTSGALPVDIELTDRDAMIPSRSIATVPKVVVVARLSRSGAPQQQSGDLYGEAEYEFGKTAGPLTIIIDRTVP